MKKFQPIYNATIIHADTPHRAEAIVQFLNCHAGELNCNTSFYIREECIVCAHHVKPTQVSYILGVIKGYLLSK